MNTKCKIIKTKWLFVLTGLFLLAPFFAQATVCCKQQNDVTWQLVGGPYTAQGEQSAGSACLAAGCQGPLGGFCYESQCPGSSPPTAVEGCIQATQCPPGQVQGSSVCPASGQIYCVPVPPPPAAGDCITASTCPAGQVQSSGPCPPGQIICAPAPAPTADGTASQPSGPVSLTDPLGAGSIPELIGRVALGLTGIAGSLALLVFIWGGFQWLTASGNPEKIKKGRDVMLWAVLGLLVMFGSFVILRFVLQALTGATVQ